MSATSWMRGDHHAPRKHERAWRIAAGVALVLAGVLALAMPAIAALATAIVFAWLVLFAGVFELVHAWHTRTENGAGWRIGSGVVTLVLGVLLLAVPLAGITTLALIVGAFLFGGGVARAALAWKMRPEKGWGWVLADAVVSIVLAVVIVAGWPMASIAFIGFLTGFWLIVAGAWRIKLARAGFDRPA